MTLTVNVTTSWTDVVGAVGAGGALLVAALAYASEIRRRRREDRNGQAERVSAWVGDQPDGMLRTFEHPSAVHVVNHSDAMIYRVRVSDGTGSAGWFVGCLAPGERVNLPSSVDRGVFQALEVETLGFEDSAGRAWERGRGQRLRAISEPRTRLREMSVLGRTRAFLGGCLMLAGERLGRRRAELDGDA